jgi:glutathione S-transferase
MEQGPDAGRHRGWATSACLLEKDVPFQIQPVDLSKDEHKSPSFLKLYLSSKDAKI